MTPVVGIDVSHHQGRIDWGKVAGGTATINGKPRGPVQFAIIRSGDGIDPADSTRPSDREWQRNVQGCIDAGLPYGVYHHFRAARGGVTQADLTLRVMGERWSLPPTINVEWAAWWDPQRPNEKLHTSKVADEIHRCAERLESQCGRTPMLCVRRAWQDLMVPHRELAATFAYLDLWRMYYSARATEPELLPPWTDWRLWQQAGPETVEGRVPGIAGRVDVDVFHGDRRAFDRWCRGAAERPTDPAPDTGPLGAARAELELLAVRLKATHPVEAAEARELAHRWRSPVSR